LTTKTTSALSSINDGVTDNMREVEPNPGIVSAGEEQATSTNTPLIVSELLFFMNSVHDSLPAAVIKSTVADVFPEDEFLTVKSTLIDAVRRISGVSIQAHVKN